LCRETTTVPSYSRSSASGSFSWRACGDEYALNPPRKMFVPVLVTRLTTPPVERPNSASKPPVLICTSSTNSIGTKVDPIISRRLVMLRPLTTYEFSAIEAPLNETRL